LEGRVALDEITKRWTDWDIDWSGATIDHTLTTRGWKNLPVLVG
jgi:hypothetical protein